MSDFSIITCVSDPEIYESCLLSSVNAVRGQHDIEIIPIMNYQNRYSASIALNLGMIVARSNNLILVHQDVRLLGDWFTTLKHYLSKVPRNWGVFGAAGLSLKFKSKDVGFWGGSKLSQTAAVGSVWDSDDQLDCPPYWDGAKEITLCHSVDECLFVVNKKAKLSFDERFDGFHFYGADICLTARAAKKGVYSACLPLIHYGKYSTSLSRDKKYWIYLRRLHDKWHKKFPFVVGTHFHWGKNGIISYIPVTLSSTNGSSVELKGMGITKVET